MFPYIRVLQVKSSIALLCLFSHWAFAQLPADTSKQRWYVPDGVSAGSAGGFGMLWAGAAYETFSKTRMLISAGYIPPLYGDIWTVNFLFSYTGISLYLNKKVSLQLLEAGVFLNGNIGQNIYFNRPGRYPKNYYWWNSALRFGPFMNTGINFEPDKKGFKYSLYFHCNTNDLYIVSYNGNAEVINIYDILVFGIGLKVQFKKLNNFPGLKKGIN